MRENEVYASLAVALQARPASYRSSNWATTSQTMTHYKSADKQDS